MASFATPSAPKHSRLEALPGVWLDAQRCVYFEESKTLAVADLHLGYAWAGRAQGQLLPIHRHAPASLRLKALCDHYQPQRVVCLGDVLHRALPIAGIREELDELCAQVPGSTELWLLLGNHDRGLEKWPIPTHIRIAKTLPQGRHLFLHGDVPPPEVDCALRIIGHEHPAIDLGDGVATFVKYPCFLVAPGLLVLPSFSPWTSGTSYGQHPFMSDLARTAAFTHAIAILGDKLLRIPLAARSPE